MPVGKVKERGDVAQEESVTVDEEQNRGGRRFLAPHFLDLLFQTWYNTILPSVLAQRYANVFESFSPHAYSN